MSYEPTVWVDGDHVTSAKLNKLEQGVNSMSYTPTVWNAGDVVTAEKLNKLEQGVADSGGGGDLSTATMAITMGKDTDYASATSLPVVVADSGVGVLQEVGQSDYEVVLVKGSVEAEFGTAEPITTYSGDVVVGQYELSDDTYYTPVTITGDCALTLVGWKNE